MTPTPRASSVSLSGRCDVGAARQTRPPRRCVRGEDRHEANEKLAGNYGGGYNPSALNGVQENVGTILVNHAGSSFSATFSGTPTCNFGGVYSQTGKLGEVVGSYNCGDGAAGTFDLFEVSMSTSRFSGRMSGRNQFCDWSGTFGGIRRSP